MHTTLATPSCSCHTILIVPTPISIYICPLNNITDMAAAAAAHMGHCNPTRVATEVCLTPADATSIHALFYLYHNSSTISVPQPAVTYAI